MTMRRKIPTPEAMPIIMSRSLRDPAEVILRGVVVGTSAIVLLGIGLGAVLLKFCTITKERPRGSISPPRYVAVTW